jgi:hypothetical protein
MKNAKTFVTMLVVTLAITALAPLGRAVANDTGTYEEQRDCMSDAMMFCSQHIFAPDRNQRIAYCLWQHRSQISVACYAHFHPRGRRTLMMGRPT